MSTPNMHHREAGSCLLHNTAGGPPPTITINVAPLRAGGGHGIPHRASANDGLAWLASCGLETALRLNPLAFVRSHAGTLGFNDDALRRMWPNVLAGLSRMALGQVDALDAESLMAPVDHPDAHLDEFLLNTAQLDPHALGLPAFGLVHKHPVAGDAVPSLQLGLAFLSRVCGDSLFVSSHAPSPFAFTEKANEGDLLLLVPAIYKGGLS